MIKKVEITQVWKNTTNKAGDKYLISKGQYAGQNFTRVGIQTDKTGEDTYYNNALATDKVMTIEIGQSLLLNFTEEPRAEGEGKWFNFNFPTKDQLAEFAAEAAV